MMTFDDFAVEPGKVFEFEVGAINGFGVLGGDGDDYWLRLLARTSGGAHFVYTYPQHNLLLAIALKPMRYVEDEALLAEVLLQGL